MPTFDPMLDVMLLETTPFPETFRAKVTFKFESTVVVFVGNQFLLVKRDVVAGSALQYLLFE